MKLEDAVLLTCPECGSQLIGSPGESITHDALEGHTWHPAGEDDPAEDHEAPEEV